LLIGLTSAHIKMVNLQRWLFPPGWDVRLVRGAYAELLGSLLLSFIFNLTAVNSMNNAALAAGAAYAVLGVLPMQDEA